MTNHNTNTFISKADKQRYDIIPAQDCSGFLFALSQNTTLDNQDPNQVTNMAITLTIIDHINLTTTVYTDGTDYDMDYYEDELIDGIFITYAFSTGRYTIRYTVTGDNIDDIVVEQSIMIDCNCCLYTGLNKLAELACDECDPQYKKNFIKAYALSKAIELSPSTVNKVMLKRAIKMRDDLCDKLCNCKNC